jgi:hypothetical protein
LKKAAVKSGRLICNSTMLNLLPVLQCTDMRRRSILLCLSLVGFVCATLAPIYAEVIISEIMYNPYGSAETGREWVELYNTGASAVNIGGWQFGDSQDGTWADAFPAGTTIGPQQTLIVTGDSASFDLGWGSGINRIQVANFPSLANSPSPTNETAAIRNASDVIQDSVNYDQNFDAVSDAWPKINGDDGQSIFLLPQGLSSAGNNDGDNWKPSMWGVYNAQFRTADGDNHGSPGYVATTPQAPFTPLPDVAWSMVYMPDTQNYVKWGDYQQLLPKVTSWIRDNRDAYKIKAVLQGGDIVNNNNTVNPPINPSSGDQNSTSQWQAAQAGFYVLNGHLPYILAAGNHDHGTTNAQNRETQINTYFPISANPLIDPAQGGILKGTMIPGEIQNSYFAFTAPDNRKMLIFSLEWEPRPATVAWANQVAALPQYADYTAMLLTHNYLGSNSTRSNSTNVAADFSGEELWDGLIRTRPNFQMTMNGHFGGDGVGFLQSTNNAGGAVHQMFFNTQFETMGADGWIRLLEFLEDGTTVRVRTYSTLHNLERTASAFSFTFQLSPIPAADGDYNANGVVDAADYDVWRKALGGMYNAAADGNDDGVVNQADYTYWRQRFGNSLSGSGAGSSAAVPEPAGVPSLMLSIVAFLLIRRGCHAHGSAWA